MLKVVKEIATRAGISALLLLTPMAASAEPLQVIAGSGQASDSAAEPEFSVAVVDPNRPEDLFDPARLTPYFSGAEADAVRQLLAGHAATALKRLTLAPSNLPARFVRAQALAAAGNHAQAASEFEALADDYRALSARCHCLAAASYEAAGDLNRSARNWEACAADPPHAVSAPLAAARLLAKRGQRWKALDLLAPVAANPGWGRASALLLTGQIRQALGQAGPAVDAYRATYVEEPASAAAATAHAALREIARHTKAPLIGVDDQLTRIDILVSDHHSGTALRELDALHLKPLCAGPSCKPWRCRPDGELVAHPVETESDDAVVAATDGPDDGEDEIPRALIPARQPQPFTLARADDDEDKPDAVPATPACALPAPRSPADPTSCRATLLRGLALSQAHGGRGRGLDLLRSVYARCGAPDVRARALFHAQALAARVLDTDAYDLALIDALQFPDQPTADLALLAAADRARDQGDGHSERLSLRLLVRRYPKSDVRAEALFRLFWSHRVDGRPDRGLQYLDALAKEYDGGPREDGTDAERGRYWWGRSVSTSAVHSDRARGVEALATLARDRPTTYYGLLARSFIASIDPAHPVSPVVVAPSEGPLRLGLLSGNGVFKAAVEFWRMGEGQEARDLLAAIDLQPLREDGRRGSESILIIAEMLQRLGDDRMAHTIARHELLRIIRDGTDPLGQRAAVVCYPLAFRQAVAERASQAECAPDLLQGLMREESALNPMARSPTGARGLTQVMPATARLVARSLGIRHFTANALWQPETNIRIGSVYLGRMLKQFGHPGLAAAAYNAGPNAVAKWLTGAGSAFDEFVEEIPFSETRGYVKRVLQSWAAYSYLYEPHGKPVVKVSLLMPATAAPTR